MVLGLPVTGTMMLVGGALLFTLVLFQVLLGMRVIKLGKRHRIVHRRTAYAIMALAAVHGLLAVAYVTGARLG
jgi:heme A synthase